MRTKNPSANRRRGFAFYWIFNIFWEIPLRFYISPLDISKELPELEAT